MFIPPNTTPDPSIGLAAKFLNESNDFINTCRTFQKNQFQSFWYPNGTPRTPSEVNAILEQMDLASPGQSAQFFQSAKELVELILSIVPDGLGQEDWMPPYEYAVDPQTYSLRVNE